jgi:hypothetical protein
MLEGGTGFAVYLALKLGGYAAWSVAGARWFSSRRRSVAAGLALGALRLVIGWGTGLLVAPLAIAALQADRVPTFYFTALALVRWFEWGAIDVLLAEPRTFGAFSAGSTGRRRLWRLGGIFVSYLADAPFLLGGGFPHGRIFC